MREYDGNDNVYIYIYTLYVNIIPLKGFENSKSDETFLYVDRGTPPSTPEKYEEFWWFGFWRIRPNSMKGGFGVGEPAVHSSGVYNKSCRLCLKLVCSKKIQFQTPGTYPFETPKLTKMKGIPNHKQLKLKVFGVCSF